MFKKKAPLYDYDFYFASPFFNNEQVEREERLKEKLRKLGFSVFSPKESCHLSPITALSVQEQVFVNNCQMILRSKAVFAITDGKDVGTIWECGFAYGFSKPIVYYAETLGDNMFNLMLAQSGSMVCLKEEHIEKGALEYVLDGGTYRYGGTVE